MLLYVGSIVIFIIQAIFPDLVSTYLISSWTLQVMSYGRHETIFGIFYRYCAHHDIEHDNQKMQMRKDEIKHRYYKQPIEIACAVSAYAYTLRIN